jgi:hypothetical protein
LLVPIGKPARSRALLAIAFAGGMLNPQLPALSENKAETTDSVIQQIVNSAQLSPEVRADNLLKLASGYLRGDNRTSLEASFGQVANQASTNRDFRNSRREDFLVDWASQVSSEEGATNQSTNAKSEPKSDAKSIPGENSALAVSTLQQALTQLEQASDKFAKLHMYFIASRLFQKAGNNDGLRTCNAVLEKNFEACEGTSQVDEERIRAASSVLNLMANSLISVYIPNQNPLDYSWMRPKEVKPYTENDFKESEKLKLRALAMVDRLDSKNQLRRKAHRDLALWYMKLGKTEMAEKEKQTLFELVGVKDDSILYPQAAGCGQLVWWHKAKSISMMGCGMG